jgi:hypothetical protein
MQLSFTTKKKIIGATVGIVLLVGLGVMLRQHVQAQAPMSSSILLFSFVTAVGGFDTGLVITNASRTPASAGQSGTCALSFYGTEGPSPPTQNTSAILAGKQAAFTLSNGGFDIAPARGFQGYIVAVCNFPSAQGVAAVSDIGLNRLLSLVPATVLASTPSNGL